MPDGHDSIEETRNSARVGIKHDLHQIYSTGIRISINSITGKKDQIVPVLEGEVSWVHDKYKFSLSIMIRRPLARHPA